MNENCACEEEFIGDHSLKRKRVQRECVTCPGHTGAEWNQIPGVLILSPRTRTVNSKNMLGLCHEFVGSLSSPMGEIPPIPLGFILLCVGTGE